MSKVKTKKTREERAAVRRENGLVLVRLIRESKPIHWGLLLAVFLDLILIACALATPELLGELVQQMYDYWGGSFEGTDLLAALRPLCLLLAGVYVLNAAVSYGKDFLLNQTVSKYFTAGLRIRLSAKVSRLSVRYLDKMPVGEFVEHMNDDVGELGFSLHNIVDTLALGFLQILAVSVVMFLEDWRLASLVIVFMPFSVWLSSKLSAKSERYFDEMFEQSGKHYTVVEESYSNYQTVKAYNLEGRRTRAHAEVNGRLRGAATRASFLMGTVSPIIAFSNELAYILICIVGAYLIVRRGVSVGTVVTAIFFANRFSSPLEQIAGGLSSLQRVRSAAKRVFGILDESEERDIIADAPAESAAEEPESAVSFEHVDFAYDPAVPLIRDMNIRVEPGQKVAIVGPTGAGKTTLVNLLMRFYDIDAGVIRVGGRDISGISRDEIRSRFAMVLQDSWIFKGTVAENVAYGRPGAARGEIERACDLAYCDHFIRTFPKGYDTVIGEDTVALSGGQKQLLTIARALLADREFLILDEATSNVDTRTELLIRKAMDRLTEGRTCFIIAHRLQTVTDADLILVMDGGAIVESGTHRELLKKKGFYWKLYNSQEN